MRIYYDILKNLTLVLRLPRDPNAKSTVLCTVSDQALVNDNIVSECLRSGVRLLLLPLPLRTRLLKEMNTYKNMNIVYNYIIHKGKKRVYNNKSIKHSQTMTPDLLYIYIYTHTLPAS